MGINIWLPIVVNVLIAMIMVAGIFIGRKNGVKYELLKLLVVCALCVGTYFLSPILTNLVIKIKFIGDAIAAGVITAAIVKSLVILVSFLLVYLIATLIFKCVRKAIHKKEFAGVKAAGVKNSARPAKVKGLTKADTRKLKKQNKELKKAQRKHDKELRRIKVSKASMVFGAIIGLICAIIVGFIVTLPLKPVFAKSAEAGSEISQIEKGYEYTPYGQLDKLTGVVDFILK